MAEVNRRLREPERWRDPGRVDDTGHVKGLDLDFKTKDALERRIHQLARTRIKPAPPVEVVFEEIRGMTVVRVSVARGEKPLYTLDNVVYLRRRSSDVHYPARRCVDSGLE
jgi:predicted HTH transcriptional regulator